MHDVQSLICGEEVLPPVPSIVIDDERFDEEVSRYDALLRRAGRYHDVQAQIELDRWLKDVQPELKKFAEKQGWNYEAEVSRVQSTVRRI